MSSTTRSEAEDVFAIVDAMDSAAFAELFTEDGEFVFANTDPLVGPDQIRAGNDAFFDTIAGMKHTIRKEWTIGADTIAELDVTYDRRDGRQVTIPVVSIWHRGDTGKIDTYRVYIDLAPVYA